VKKWKYERENGADIHSPPFSPFHLSTFSPFSVRSSLFRNRFRRCRIKTKEFTEETSGLFGPSANKNMKPLMKKKIVALVLLHAFVMPFAALAQTADINAQIRKEGMENSKIMHTMHYLADVYGPRLTGSPNHKAAAEWAAKEMTSWGFANAALEAWDFGSPGWVSDRASGFITSPTRDSLVFEVLAWTPGTDKPVTGQAANIIIPRPSSTENRSGFRNPTQEELTAYFNTVRDQVKGKIVLVGKPASIPVNFNPPLKRLSPAQTPTPTPTPTPAPQPSPTPTPRTDLLTTAQLGSQVDAFLVASGALIRVNDAGREHGQIRAFGEEKTDPKTVLPTVILRNEDFGRVVRLLADGPVTLEFDIRNRYFPEGVTSYNVVAEIPGSDKKDEVVMLGGHLDSWHSATGATDNAIGCAVMMEAARILKAIGVKPRRTIRVALWSGEEQGLLGSRAYVKKHFGSAEAPTADYNKFAGYLNIDMGTGQARRFSVFGPPEAADIMKGIGEPFTDIGFIGSTATKNRGLGGSDHTSFNQAGLPGISVNQDPIEYFTHTWHTNLDTYERIIEADVKKSAIIVAAAVYQLAIREEMLPRFKVGEMPPLPPPSN
jgi:carboxypeptidase Q